MQNLALVRKLKRLPEMEMPVTRMIDWLEVLWFKIRRKRRKKLNDALSFCRTNDQIFECAAGILPPHQDRREIVHFLDYVQSLKLERVCEIGLGDSGTNLLMLRSLKSLSLMIGIDLFVRNKRILRYFANECQNLYYLDGSSADKAIQERVANILSGEKLDLLFIDGDHSYDGVKADFLHYRSLVREDGIIVFHDIVPDNFLRKGEFTGHWVGGVPMFWSKIKGAYPAIEIIQHPDQDGLGIGLLRYREKAELPSAL